MAKNSGIIQFTGKLGELVGAQGQDGRTIIRQRRYNIKNPKTDAQCAQRMIFATAGQAIAQLKPILNNSFEGKSFGAKSIQYARSLYLRMLRTAPTLDNNGMVYLPKGSLNFPINAYPLSQGSLPIPLHSLDDSTYILSFESGLTQENIAAALPSVAFKGIEVGQQITFVICATSICAASPSGSVRVKFCRFAYKDDTLPAFVSNGGTYHINSAAIDASLAEGPFDRLSFTAGDNETLVDFAEITAADSPVGAGFIVSDKALGKRSTSYLMFNPSSTTRGGVSAAEALPTYADGASSLNLPSDYYLQNSVSPAE